MDRKEFINLVQRALKLINEVEGASKDEGLDSLGQLLELKDNQLVALGYDQVIFKELIKMAQFESGQYLSKTLELLEAYYFNNHEYLDELAETFIYRVARSTNREVCQLCLEKISSLIDNFDESIAKHSKQLLKLADLNEITDLNSIISEILVKMEIKLPKRKNLLKGTPYL